RAEHQRVLVGQQQQRHRHQARDRRQDVRHGGDDQADGACLTFSHHTLYLLGEPDQRAEPTQREYARAYRHRSHHDQGLGPERRTVAVTRPGAVSLNHDRTTSLNTMSCGEWDASESNRPRPRGRAPGACVPATSVAEGLEAVRSRHRLHFLISRSLRTRAALMRLEWALSLFLIAFLLISRSPGLARSVVGFYITSQERCQPLRGGRPVSEPPAAAPSRPEHDHEQQDQQHHGQELYESLELAT